jgi:hypothetical protein
MNEKELLMQEIKNLITDSQKEGVKKADLEKTINDLNERIAKLSKPEIDSLPETVNKLIAEQAKLTAAVNAMNESANKKDAERPLTFKEALVEAWREAAKNRPDLITERNDDNGKRLSALDYFKKLGNKNTPEMVVKTDMTEANIVQSNVATVRLTDLDPKRVSVPLTIYPHVLDWMPVKGVPAGKKYMSLLVVYSYSDGAGTKTQGSTATISSFLFKTVEFVCATIGTKFRLTDESLDDLPEAMEEIALVGPSKIKDNIDYQILGSAGDDTATIKGLFAASKHTDFAGSTTYADTIPNANEIDVIATMKLQAAASNYKLTDVVMSPTDVHKIAALKDQLDNSIFDRRVSFDSLGNPVAICGLLIRENAQMTANTLVGVDRNMLQIGDRKQMTMEVGYDGNDFTEGFKTVRINVRLAFGVRDPLAVIYCSDLAQGVSDITA